MKTTTRVWIGRSLRGGRHSMIVCKWRPRWYWEGGLIHNKRRSAWVCARQVAAVLGRKLKRGEIVELLVTEATA